MIRLVRATDRGQPQLPGIQNESTILNIRMDSTE